MSLLGRAIGLSMADLLMGEAAAREERRRNAALHRRNDASGRRIAELEEGLRELKRGGRRR